MNWVDVWNDWLHESDSPVNASEIVTLAQSLGLHSEGKM